MVYLPVFFEYLLNEETRSPVRHPTPLFLRGAAASRLPVWPGCLGDREAFPYDRPEFMPSGCPYRPARWSRRVGVHPNSMPPSASRAFRCGCQTLGVGGSPISKARRNEAQSSASANRVPRLGWPAPRPSRSRLGACPGWPASPPARTACSTSRQLLVRSSGSSHSRAISPTAATTSFTASISVSNCSPWSLSSHASLRSFR